MWLALIAALGTNTQPQKHSLETRLHKKGGHTKHIPTIIKQNSTIPMERAETKCTLRQTYLSQHKCQDLQVLKPALCQLRATIVLKALAYNMRLLSIANYSDDMWWQCIYSNKLWTSIGRHFQTAVIPGWNSNNSTWIWTSTMSAFVCPPYWPSQLVKILATSEIPCNLDGKVSLDAWFLPMMWNYHKLSLIVIS